MFSMIESDLSHACDYSQRLAMERIRMLSEVKLRLEGMGKQDQAWILFEIDEQSKNANRAMIQNWKSCGELQDLRQKISKLEDKIVSLKHTIHNLKNPNNQIAEIPINRGGRPPKTEKAKGKGKKPKLAIAQEDPEAKIEEVVES